MLYKLKTSLTTDNNALPKKLLRNFRLIFRNFENKNAVPKKKKEEKDSFRTLPPPPMKDETTKRGKMMVRRMSEGLDPGANVSIGGCFRACFHGWHQV